VSGWGSALLFAALLAAMICLPAAVVIGGSR
jgi:hypothetical protein